MTRYAPYVLLGIVLWVCVLKSGVHATLAGVVLALAIPLRGGAEGESPLERMEHALHPWVAFLVMPVFAFANAGVSLAGLSLRDLFAPLSLGIAAGSVRRQAGRRLPDDLARRRHRHRPAAGRRLAGRRSTAPRCWPASASR